MRKWQKTKKNRKKSLTEALNRVRVWLATLLNWFPGILANFKINRDVSLIDFKPNKDKFDFASHRSVYLFYIDVEIFSNVLANRLDSLLPD